MQSRTGGAAPPADPPHHDRTAQAAYETPAEPGHASDASALDPIITIDESGRIVGLSAAAEGAFGTSERVRGRDLIDLVVGPQESGEPAGISAYRESGVEALTERAIEITATRADGTTFPAELAVSQIPIGGPAAYMAFVRDMSAHRRQVQRRLAQHALTRAIAESTTFEEGAAKILRALCLHLDWQIGAMWLADPRDGVLRCTAFTALVPDQARRFEACSRERTFTAGVGVPGRVQATGEVVWIPDVTVSPDFARVDAAVHDDLHAVVAFPVMLRGEVAGAIELLGNTARAPDPDLLRMMAVIGSQIGQFIERREAEAELRRGEERYRAVVESLSEMLCRFQPDGTILFVNTAYAEARGTTVAALTGASFWDFIPETDRPGVRALLDRLTPESPEIRIENRFQTQDGVRWVLWTNRALAFDAQGRWTEAQSAGIDITDRKRAEQALREADRRKDEFLATLAHELRNPLAPLRNALELMRLAGNDPMMLEQARTMMARQFAQMVRLIDDLLDLSRISSGKIVLRKERLPLARVLQQAVDTSRPAIEQGGHDLTISLPPERVNVEADATRLAQVFANLLNNAAKFTEPGGHIRLTMQLQGDQAVVTVRDNGVGIPPDMLDEVFEMFTQVDRSLERRNGGLGIGLSLVKRIVAMHTGTVEARSDGPGTGSEFIVRLPVANPIDEPTRPRQAPVVRGGGRRILVADDNRDAAVSLAMVLRMMGNETRAVHDGLEALEAATEFEPDVILLDLGMPRLNGFDAARRLREREWRRRPVLIAVTGWGQEDDHRRSRDAGFDAHLVKPVDPADLEETLSRLLPAS